jgi:iron complex transport system ATP-binding protein
MLELRSCHIGKGAPLYTIGNVAVEPGRLTALIGANGAGKSTLLDAIALGNDCGGTIAWNGKSLHNLGSSVRSRYIALVESRFSGSEYLSTQEYLDLGRYPHTGFGGRLNATDKEVVARFAGRLKLEHLLAQSTLTLSDGERQRAGIARALIQETPVILLDEPTSFLDYPNKRRIMQLLSEIAQSDNKIVLLASHDLELCLEYCDDFLVINKNTRQLEHYAVSGLMLDRLIDIAFPPED